MKAKVAVITRTKDRALLLRRAIQSVLRQTFPDWVHVIVNDGGDRAELENLLDGYRDEYQGRLVVVHHETSQGMQNASNAGLAATDSVYVNIHDDDDAWEPEFLAQTVAFLEEEGPESRYQGVISQTVRIFEEIDAAGNIIERWREDYQPRQYLNLYDTTRENPFAPIAFLYRRAVHDQIGTFRQQFDVLGDWDFNLRFLLAHEIGTIEAKLALYYWRLKQADKIYGNTVTVGLSKHHKKLNEMRNHYLREEIMGRQPALGTLLNMTKTQAEIQGALHDHTNRLTDMRDELGQAHWHAYHTHELLQPRKGFFDRERTTAKNEQGGIQFERFTPPKLRKLDYEEIFAQVRAADIVSFDIFDTLLLRVVYEPGDPFFMLEWEMREAFDKPDELYAYYRKEAERTAREVYTAQQKKRKRLGEDINLGEIYETYARMVDMPTADIEHWMQVEIGAEERVLYANPAIFPIYEKARELGKKIIYVSDMYLPPETVKGALAANGYDAELPLFLSGERRLTKHSGRLWSQVVEELGVDPGTIFHLGDNYNSDITQAEEKGIEAFHYDQTKYLPRARAQQLGRLSEASANDGLASLAHGLTRRRYVEGRAGKQFWEDLGYEISGPLYFLYLNWMLYRAERLRLDHIYFLARDGYYLQKAYELMRTAWGLPLESTYLYASRRLWNVPRIFDIDENDWDFILTPNPRHRVRDFFLRLGFDPEQYRELFTKHDFKDLDEVITTHHGIFKDLSYRDRLYRVFCELQPEIVQKAAAEREELYAYFSQVGLDRGRPGIVDVGWQASSINSLQTLMGDRLREKMHGFYFATWRFAQKAIDNGCEFDSYFVHLDHPHSRNQILEGAVSVIELLFTAPHPTIIGIEQDDDGQRQAVYGREDVESEDYAHLEEMWNGAEAFIRDMLAQVDKPRRDTGLFYLEQALSRLLLHPTLAEAQAIGKLGHREGFGTNIRTQIIPTPPSRLGSMLSTKRLQEGYNFASWRRGYLTLLHRNQLKKLRQP